MSSDLAPTRGTTPTTWRAGVVWGLALGVTVWVLYFVQATAVDLLFWDAVVVPTTVGASAVALAVAACTPSQRSFCLGLAGGVFATLPIALLAFGLVFAAWDLN